MQFNKTNDYAGFTTMEQIRAAEETFEWQSETADEFCSCDQCESRWKEYDFDWTDF